MNPAINNVNMAVCFASIVVGAYRHLAEDVRDGDLDSVAEQRTYIAGQLRSLRNTKGMTGCTGSFLRLHAMPLQDRRAYNATRSLAYGPTCENCHCSPCEEPMS